MSPYRITWVTDRLAIGPAPMSFDDIDVLRGEGINAIVNLCGEFCDLHDIERESGFEVYHLPIPDEGAPDIPQIESALEWLDEAIYLDKKVFVHCRHGVGRTGTFLTTYLLRRGFGLKQAKRTLKTVRPTPSSFYQWRLLRRYDKSTKRLTIREPTIEGKNIVNLSPYFAEYEALLREVDSAVRTMRAASTDGGDCGESHDTCCHEPLRLTLIESAYLSHMLNKHLSRQERSEAMSRALAMPARSPEGAPQALSYTCPLSVDRKCIAFPYRPTACRLYGVPIAEESLAPQPSADSRSGENLQGHLHRGEVDALLHRICQHLFFSLNSTFLKEGALLFPMQHVVSGKFVEDYFAFLIRKG